MRGRSKIIFSCVFYFPVTFWILLNPVFATEISIVGKVNYFYQIIADGQIYEVANTAMGDDLVMNHIAKNVAVTGTVEDNRDVKKITVKSFKIVPEFKSDDYHKELEE